MWELIEANRRKSAVLIISLFLILLLLGAMLGCYASAATQQTDFLSSLEYQNLVLSGAQTGALGGAFLFVLLFAIAYFGGDGIFLDAVGAKPISHDIHPMLFNIVEEMKIASGLPVLPKIYIVSDKAPNAFATGIRTQNSAVSVTAGLLARLNRDELQGVIAHEMSHIKNRDVLFMTLSATMLGSIQILSDTIMRGVRYSDGSRIRYRSERSGASGSGALIVLILALVIAALSVLLARCFYFAISRRREYLADACAARFTRYPEGLASALEKISSTDAHVSGTNSFTSASFIVNALDAKEEGAFAELASTHPPIQKRIQILRAMTLGASFRDYESSYASILKNKNPILPASARQDEETVQLRAANTASPAAPAPEASNLNRDSGDLIAAANGFAFMKCACGLRFKIPPHFEEKKITCPRCGLVNELPFAGPIGTAERPSSAENFSDNAEKNQSYRRKSTGWESFFCSCGKLVQLAPSFSAPEIQCRHCGKKIRMIA